jgi:Calcium binding
MVRATKAPIEPERERRITYEAVVDCYNETERAMGWYYYLERALAFPFKARCQNVRKTSPLTIGEVVYVVSLADEDDCMNEVLVNVECGQGVLAVPLSQLTCVTRRGSTLRGVADWQYWVARGYKY